jgi:hypothetical protein
MQHLDRAPPLLKIISDCLYLKEAEAVNNRELALPEAPRKIRAINNPL